MRGPMVLVELVLLAVLTPIGAARADQRHVLASAEQGRSTGASSAAPALTEAQIAATLAAPTGGSPPPLADTGTVVAPPPPPRHHGFVLVAGIGLTGFTGSLKTVAPIASTFRLQLGFEPATWLMPFVATEASFTSTRYANPPPQPRGFALFAFGGGIRLTAPLSRRVLLFAQGEIGWLAADSDALRTYGYPDAATLKVYFGGVAGLDWYQVGPHVALFIQGGARRVPGLDRIRGTAEIAWSASTGLRYAF